MAQPQVQVHSTTTTQRFEGGTYPSQQHILRNDRNEGVNYPYYDRHDGGVRTLFSERGPSISQILAIVAGIAIGGTLFFLASISFIISLIGLMIMTPIFILFSPILVPAALTLGLAVAGIITADACGLTGLMSLSWMVKYVRDIIRDIQGTMPRPVDSMKGRIADMADYLGQKTKDVGQKTKEVGQDMQTKAHETKRST